MSGHLARGPWLLESEQAGYVRLSSDQKEETLTKIFQQVSKIAEVKQLSFHEIERRAHIPKGTIATWEHSRPDYAHFIRVAGALRVEISDLL